MKLIYCLLGLLCLHANGPAQHLPQQTNRLSIGETMPDILLQNLYNYPEAPVAFSGIQGELTIIDFWARFCGSCIASFPKMHNLQSKFKNGLRILMVNGYQGDDAEKVRAFFKQQKGRNGLDFTLPYILKDTLFSSFFPHKSIPHYVWIDKNRKIIAITSSEQVNEQNIIDVIAGKKVELAYKNDDLLFDGETDKLVTQDTAKTTDLLFRSVITAYKENLGHSIHRTPAPEGGIAGISVINYSLLSFYQMAFPEVFRLPFNRIVIEPSVQNEFYNNLNSRERKRYCYELITHPVSSKQIITYLRTDLERCFNITAAIERRSTDCFVLKAGAGIRQIITKNIVAAADTDERSLNKYIHNGSVADLTAVLGVVLNKPWVDETGLSKNIDLQFPYDFYSFNLQQVKDFLLSRGLDFTEEARVIEVAVLKPNTIL